MNSVTSSNGNTKRLYTSPAPYIPDEMKRHCPYYRPSLADEPEDESKFRKLGEKYVFDILRTELDQMLYNNRRFTTTLLYQYQIEAVLAVHAHFDWPVNESLPKAALIVAPPGSGKSGMATLIPYVLGSRKVLVLTPSKIITEQLASDFGHPNINKSFFNKCGMYTETGELRRLLERVETAVTQMDIDGLNASNLLIVNAQKFGGNSASSLSTTTRTPEQIERVEDQLQQFDTIIVDEAHHYPATTWVNIVERFREKKIVLLTATPFRGENRMVETLKQIVQQVYEIQRSDLEGKTIRRIEFIEKTAVKHRRLEDKNFLDQLRDDIFELLGKHDRQERRVRHQAIILVRTKHEAQAVARGLGGRATCVTSEKSGRKHLELFNQQKKDVVVVCGMLREGYDNANVSLVVILRNCQSRVLFEQFCGRCMRMNRSLTGKELDKAEGTVLSYQHFQQSKMWAKMQEVAEEDPSEEAEDDNDGEENVRNVMF